MSMISFRAADGATTPALAIQLSTEERLYQLAATHDESRVFAVYAAVTRHLRGGGGHRLSNQMVADMTPGCGVGKARDCLALLCEAGLLVREGDANSAYFYRLPSPAPPLRVVQQAPPRDERCTPHVQQCTPRVTKEEEEEEGISIDGEGEKSLSNPPANEQARIAQAFVRDPEVIAIATRLEPATVKHIAAQARQDNIKSPADYFAKSIRNAPTTPPRPTAKPQVTAPPSGKYAAFVDGAPAPDAPAPTATTPPSGPVILPQPDAVPPPPPDTDDADTRTVRAYLRQMLRGEAHLLDRATITRDDNTWTVIGPPALLRYDRNLHAYIADALATEREAITVTVEATS